MPLAERASGPILNLVPAPFRPADTSVEAWDKQFELYRRMSTVQKARAFRDITLAANAFALAGLRQRHPEASEGELLLRLAVLRLGEDLVAQAYHWRPRPDGS
jgi:hypothetical protein